MLIFYNQLTYLSIYLSKQIQFLHFLSPPPSISVSFIKIFLNLILRIGILFIGILKEIILSIYRLLIGIFAYNSLSLASRIYFLFSLSMNSLFIELIIDLNIIQSIYFISFNKKLVSHNSTRYR